MIFQRVELLSPIGLISAASLYFGGLRDRLLRFLWIALLRTVRHAAKTVANAARHERITAALTVRLRCGRIMRLGMKGD